MRRIIKYGDASRMMAPHPRRTPAGAGGRGGASSKACSKRGGVIDKVEYLFFYAGQPTWGKFDFPEGKS